MMSQMRVLPIISRPDELVNDSWNGPIGKPINYNQFELDVKEAVQNLYVLGYLHFLTLL